MSQMLDAAGRRRSPATMPGFHAGRPPRNKGMRYPADPPTVEESVSVMRAAGDSLHAQRLRGLIAVLWRAGLRKADAAERSDGRLGMARTPTLAHHPTQAASRTAVLRHHRPDTGTTVVNRGRAAVRP